MKLPLILATLVLSAPLAHAHADALGFVDASRVYQESTVAQRASEALKSEQAAKQGEINRAQEAARQARADKRAKPTGVQSAAARAAEVAKKDQADLDASQRKIAADLHAQFIAVCASIAKDKHLTYVLPVAALYAPPGRDYTDEAIRRWNSQDIASTAEELRRATDENIALKAKLAAAEHATPTTPTGK